MEVVEYARKVDEGEVKVSRDSKLKIFFLEEKQISGLSTDSKMMNIKSG